MILAPFEGRIGNNLFQLAATLSLAVERNTDACAYNVANLVEMRENFLLEDFVFLDSPSSQFQLRYNIKTKHWYNEVFLKYDEDFFNTPDDTFLDGFFQSEKYFKKIENKIRKNFQFKEHIIEAASKIDYFSNKNNSGFIHIRRTDYLDGDNSQAYPQPSIEYHTKCIEESNIDLIYVFSDDIPWCKEYFKKFNTKQFIFIEEKNPYISLYLMSQLNIAIITNSTFSWWGAWLNPNKNKKVYYPLQWYGEDFVRRTKNTTVAEFIKDLPCEEWNGR